MVGGGRSLSDHHLLVALRSRKHNARPGVGPLRCMLRCTLHHPSLDDTRRRAGVTARASMDSSCGRHSTRHRPGAPHARERDAARDCSPLQPAGSPEGDDIAVQERRGEERSVGIRGLYRLHRPPPWTYQGLWLPGRFEILLSGYHTSIKLQHQHSKCICAPSPSPRSPWRPSPRPRSSVPSPSPIPPPTDRVSAPRLPDLRRARPARARRRPAGLLLERHGADLRAPLWERRLLRHRRLGRWREVPVPHQVPLLHHQVSRLPRPGARRDGGAHGYAGGRAAGGGV